MLVVSCDLVTDVELHLLADVHRTHDATATVLLQTRKDQSTEGVSVPGTKSKRKSGIEVLKGHIVITFSQH